MLHPRPYALALLALTVIGPAAVPAHATETRDVRVTGVDGVTLNGTWTLPDDPEDAPDGGWPGVLLVQGSGATDRNGDQPDRARARLLRRLARDLARAGIASLRMDKRGMFTNADERPDTPGELAAFYRWEALHGDVSAGLAFVAEQPAIDSTRLAVIGHSQGGSLALAALEAGAPDVRAIVLLASPARPIGSLIREQIEAAAMPDPVPMPSGDGAVGPSPADAPSPAEMRRGLLDADAAIRAAILDTGQVPADVPPRLRALYPAYAGGLYAGWLRFDPLRTLRALETPFLVLIGAADEQVSVQKDGLLFQALLERAGAEDGQDTGLGADDQATEASWRTASAVHLPSQVSHAMKDTVDGDGVKGPVAESVMTVLLPWLGTRLSTP